jgi:hypothetical protein
MQDNSYVYHSGVEGKESDESVYNLIEKPVVEKKKEKMYRSQFSGDPTFSAPTASTFGLHGTSKPGVSNLAGEYLHPDNHGSMHFMKKNYSTMGRLVRHDVKTDTFLKKGDKTLPDPNKFQYPDSGSRKPNVPKKNECPIMGLTSSKNFIVSNAVEVILAQPKNVKEPKVRYVEKPEFGKTPEYLSSIKEEIEAEKAYIAQINSLQEQ